MIVKNEISYPLFNDVEEGPIPSPLPIQYLGSKSRIANWIIDSIRSEFPKVKVFIDLLAGSGAISNVALPHYPTIFVNDIQPYSYALLQSIFFTPREGLSEIIQVVSGLASPDILLADGRANKNQMLLEEDKHFKNEHLNWVMYKNYCESTNIIDGSQNSVDLLRNKGAHNLFISYYANTYFGVRQCLELDTLHEYANSLEPNLKEHVVAATISSMTYAVSSTTHLAQYLRPSNQQNAFNLKKRRSLSIIKMVVERLQNLLTYPMPKSGTALNLGFEQALDKIPKQKGTVVYLDPPYFKEHYSRYYHVLDTFVLYDFPYLTYNPRLGKVTEGRYRENRIVSDFGLRGRVDDAFERAFNACSNKDFNIALSYANTSLISRDSIIEKAKKAGYESKVLEKELLHSGQGQPRNRKVKEFLFLFTKNKFL